MTFLLRHLTITFVSMLMGLASVSVNAEIAVIVSKENPLNTLTRTQLANIFLGRANVFPDGGPATPVDQLESSGLRISFYQDSLNWSQAKLKAHWSRIIFTGRGHPPKQMANDEDVKEFIVGNPRGIGYIQKENVSPGVKVITIVP